MAQKIIKSNCRSVKWRVAGKRRVAGEEKMNSVAGCENFHNLRNSQGFGPPNTGTPATIQNQKL